MTAAARPFFKEIFGRENCLNLANLTPRIINETPDIDELLDILTSADQRYLSEGFIVTAEGRYVGLGTGEQLVRSVTEMRIEAARHANPLTFLPGNIPISQHIERLLARRGEFIACYLDLNHFKPFNDQYGYWRGDEMIRLLARTCVSLADPGNDFVGHVGGDDFILLMQSTDWEDRCRQIIRQFDGDALQLFDESARHEGGIHCEDRQGVMRFFPCTTLAIGAVMVSPGMFKSAEEVANEAAHAKHTAKLGRKGLAILGRSDGFGVDSDSAGPEALGATGG
jgi:GGDEF domain-containing protein